MAINTAYLVDGCELKVEPNSIDFRLTEDELEAMRKRAAKLEREARLHDDKLDWQGAGQLWDEYNELTARIYIEERFDR